MLTGRSVLCRAGFTLVELVMVIVLLAIIAAAVVVKWPVGMQAQAAKLEYQRALRFSQHMALTRKWSTAASAWGITIADNKYYVGRADADCQANCSNPECADASMCDRTLLGDSSISISAVDDIATILFNGLGEPIDASGGLLANVTFLIDGTEQLTVCAQTGYVLDGGNCP